MHRSRGEVPVVVADDPGGLTDVLGGDAMGEIDDWDTLVDHQDDAFHHANVFILKTKICSEGYGKPALSHEIGSVFFTQSCRDLHAP
ncbi:hypothetical protein DPPLL_23860 [Desulfofustis limnaeus]|uniref:Uncharacterized protein n=1 Tax=Desulfofustis limnaeus TaxID=2740163 RepID=A0ABN6M554_9BACT|nr:hypothetical protein DPPLL_23860 [Desulfofustis limnaeus]